MNFQDPKPETLQNQPDRAVESIDREMAQKVENFVRLQIHELFERAVEEPDKRRFVRDQIATIGRKVLGSSI